MYHNPILFFNLSSIFCFMWLFYKNECLIGPIFITLFEIFRSLKQCPSWITVHKSILFFCTLTQFIWFIFFQTHGITIVRRKIFTWNKNHWNGIDKGFCFFSCAIKFFAQLSFIVPSLMPYFNSTMIIVPQLINTFSPVWIISLQFG